MYNKFMSQFLTSLFHLDLSILFFFWLRKGLIQLMVLTHVIFLDQKKKKKKVLLAAIHYTKGFIHTFVLWITLVKDRQAVILDRVSDLRPSFGQAGMSFFFLKKKIYILFWINHHVDFRSCIKKGTYKS